MKIYETSLYDEQNLTLLVISYEIYEMSLYDKQNLTLLVISYEIYETSLPFINVI